MRFVARHRTAIQEAARRLIENEAYEEDGSVLIRAPTLAGSRGLFRFETDLGIWATNLSRDTLKKAVRGEFIEP